MGCQSGFKFQSTDFDDVFVRKEFFSEGGLWLWGMGNLGRLGTNSTTNKSSPVQTVSGGTNWKQVSVGHYHSAAIKTDGTLWLWGNNSNGPLGDNTTTSKSSPVQTVSGGNNWKQVSLGYSHSAAIKTDGSLWLWGAGGSGALGTNTTTNHSSPVQTVSGGNDWKQVDLGSFHSAAVKTDGSLWLWGCGNFGALGDDTTANKSSPVQTVSGGTNWKQVSLGCCLSAAIKTDGSLWLWGRNSYGFDRGPLGDNTTINRSSPVQTVSGGTNWKQVSVGHYHSAAIKTDGTLWLWGGASGGLLGTGSSTDRSSPVQTISGGTNWKQVSLGRFTSAAIKTDGSLWLWGNGSYGRLGDNTTANKSSPVQTVSGGNDWKQVSLGTYHSSAIREDCW